MATIAASTTARKTPPVYRAHFYDESGALAKIDGTIYFVSDAGALTEIEPEHCPWITVLGHAAIADTQAIMDRIHGGAARICTTRSS